MNIKYCKYIDHNFKGNTCSDFQPEKLDTSKQWHMNDACHTNFTITYIAVYIWNNRLHPINTRTNNPPPAAWYKGTQLCNVLIIGHSNCVSQINTLC